MSDKINPTYEEMVAFLEDYRKDRLASTKTGFDLQANNFNYNRAGEQLDSLKLTKGMMEPNHSIWDK